MGRTGRKGVQQLGSKLIETPVTRFDAVQRLEWFLIATVVTILVIRTQLWLTNYPQLGGGNLHIAHLLWGGLFMMIVIWLGLIFLNRRALTTMAVLGGIGFGFFIDELGKFITSDNDYFFRPAAALIYLILVVLFLVIRELSRRRHQDQRSELANALAFMPWTLTGEFGDEEYRTVSGMLDRAGKGDPQVESVRAFFDHAVRAPQRPPSRLLTAVNRIGDSVTRLTKRPRFGRVVILLMAIWGTLAVVNLLLVAVLFSDSQLADGASRDFITAASTVSTAISGALILLGVFRMRRGHRQKAYRDFRRALLVSIFVTRVFAFVESQFTAVFGLGLDILFYAAIGELAARDGHQPEGRPAGDPDGDPAGEVVRPAAGPDPS